MMSMEDTSESFNLSNVRDSLIRQEDTIIFALIERAQFGRNEPVYSASSLQAGGSSLGFWPSGRGLTLLEWLLRETEAMHGKIRRYTSPDEHPFYPVDDQVLVLPLMEYPSVLAEYAKDININEDVMALYLDVLLPGITELVDDGNYGSSAMHDVLALQALSKRIHYGKFVAEAKFREDPERYRSLIEAQDADGIMDALTYVRQEQNVVERVRSKAAAIGKDHTAVPEDGSLPLYKVDPQVVADLYDKWVMPLTKKVQVQYLLRRLE